MMINKKDHNKQMIFFIDLHSFFNDQSHRLPDLHQNGVVAQPVRAQHS